METKDVVLLPTYNERENIERIIREIFKYAPDVHVLVIDDCSPDKTGEVVTALCRHFPNLTLFSRRKKEGLGRAYLAAFERVLSDSSTGRVITMDADFSHNPSYLPQMRMLGRTCDIVVGSRYVPGGATEGWELWRTILSRYGNRYARLITGLPVHDLTSGFMLIHTKLLRSVLVEHLDVSGYAFMIELKHLLWSAGGTFTELPILFRNRTGGESKLTSHIVREGVIAPWKMRFKRRHRRPVSSVV